MKRLTRFEVYTRYSKCKDMLRKLLTDSYFPIRNKVLPNGRDWQQSLRQQDRFELLAHILTAGQRAQQRVRVGIFKIAAHGQPTRQASNPHTQRQQLLA